MFLLCNFQQRNKSKLEREADRQSRLNQLVEKRTLQEQTWIDFQKLYPDPESCIKELIARVADDYFSCERCRKDEFEQLKNGRVRRCRFCGLRTFVFAGTPLEGIKRPDAWLARAFFFERHVDISSNAFSKLVGIASSTSLNIFKVLTEASSELMSNMIELPSTLFSRAISKRSSETPASQHPIAEIEKMEEFQAEIEEQEKIQEEKRRSAIIALKREEKYVLEIISKHNDLGFDKLYCLANMEYSDLISHIYTLQSNKLVQTTRFGGYQLYQGKTQPQEVNLTEAINSTLKEFVSYVRENHHGVSRKCLQFYLAAFWMHKDREHWVPGSVLNALAHCSPERIKTIRAVISPFLLRVPG